MKRPFVSILFVTLYTLSSNSAQAELIDRGSGLIYDSILNVTWLQDANYAKTSGYDSDGRMTWSQATEWASNLSYVDTIRNVVYDDWRLPSFGSLNNTLQPFYRIGTSGDYNELTYMYQVNLNLKVFWVDNSQQCSVVNPFCLTDTGPFKNLDPTLYWYGNDTGKTSAYLLHMAAGDMRLFDKEHGTYDNIHFWPNEYSAWAVRDGDVASVSAVPEPNIYAMMLAGLGIIGSQVRRRKQDLA